MMARSSQPPGCHTERSGQSFGKTSGSISHFPAITNRFRFHFLACSTYWRTNSTISGHLSYFLFEFLSVDAGLKTRMKSHYLFCFADELFVPGEIASWLRTLWPRNQSGKSREPKHEQGHFQQKKAACKSAHTQSPINPIGESQS